MQMVGDYLVGPALIGGALIGLGVAVMLLFNGKIAGISGVLGGALQKWVPDLSWRLAFLVGIPVAVMLVSALRNMQPAVEL
ncbi:MAG TPA: YeeE/YedE family protein, partial [Pseudomonadaceae bacterium]|nr:YeeE/YedE family protein [Pseudomonadaceae bacterium]